MSDEMCISRQHFCKLSKCYFGTLQCVKSRAYIYAAYTWTCMSEYIIYSTYFILYKLCILVVLMYDTDIFPAQCQFPFTAVEAQNYTACTVKVSPQSFMLANVHFYEYMVYCYFFLISMLCPRPWCLKLFRTVLVRRCEPFMQCTLEQYVWFPKAKPLSTHSFSCWRLLCRQYIILHPITLLEHCCSLHSGAATLLCQQHLPRYHNNSIECTSVNLTLLQ